MAGGATGQTDRRVVRPHPTGEAGQRVDAVPELFTGCLPAALDDLDDLDAGRRAAVRAALPALARIARHVRGGGR